MNAPASINTGAPGDQYRRLFGNLTPKQVMLSPVASPSLLSGDGNSGSPPALCDPSQAAGQLVHELLSEVGHPSAASLATIAQLRLRHVAKGYRPESDSQRGPMFFWHGVHEFWWRAMDAGDDRTARRNNLIAAAALLIAAIDVEDFREQKGQTGEA